jgi:outer membrane immunogenic protein
VKTKWFGTLRGRLGYVTGPSLIYATGGAAFVSIEETFGGLGTIVAPATHSSTKTGWTAGGGIETKLSRNWSTKTEYLYIGAGSTSFAANPQNFAGVATFQHQFHLITTGFNYKLGDGPFEMFPFFGAPLSSPDRWSGLYAGINAGGGLSATHVAGGPVMTGETDLNGRGFAGGLQGGYNWIIGSRWLAGVEGDIGYLGINRSDPQEWNDARNFGQKTDWYGTARVRVGSTTGPALLYMTGGGAWVRVRDNLTFLTGQSDAATRTAGGWTYGGGTEVAIDSRWSARLEYLYIDAGKTHRSITSGINTWDGEFKDRFQVVRAGLNYRFGGPDVVTARY